VFTSSLLTESNSVWFPDYPQQFPNPNNPEHPTHLSYIFLPADNPKKDLSSAQYAMKIDGKQKGFDFSTSYYHGYSHIPEYSKTEIPVSNDSLKVLVKEIHIPWDVIGIDFAKAFGPFGIRAEAAYFITKGVEATEGNSENDFIQYSLGADYLTFVGNSNSSIHVMAEWIQEYVPSGFQYPVTSLNHLFQKTLLTRIECDYRNFLNVSFQYLYDIKSNEFYIQPKIAYDPIDGLNLILLADFLGGDTEGFFGQYSENDRVQFKIKYCF